MKRLIHLILLPASFLTVFSCGEAEEKEKGDAINELSEEMKKLDGAAGDWTNKGDGKFFTIDIPNYMTPRVDLNALASLQFGYVERKQFEQFENYALVMVQTHEAIDTLKREEEFTITSYWKQVMSEFGEGLDNYEELTTEPGIDTVNGMSCILNEMRGSLASADVYYRLAVFEGKLGFYQVLCWCIESQKQKFIPDMDRMIGSFKEK